MASRVEALARVRQLAASGRAREIRIEAGVSLGEIAADVGCTPTCIWRWERADDNPNGRSPTGAAAIRYLRVLERLESQLDGRREVAAHG
jgi:transcriptional regulator with XRE-family HTH domain